MRPTPSTLPASPRRLRRRAPRLAAFAAALIPLFGLLLLLAAAGCEDNRVPERYASGSTPAPLPKVDPKVLAETRVPPPPPAEPLTPTAPVGLEKPAGTAASPASAAPAAATAARPPEPTTPHPMTPRP